MSSPPQKQDLVAVVPFQDAAHRAKVIALWTAVFGYEAAHNQPAPVLDKKLAVDDGLLFVAVSGQEVIGTVMAGYDGHRGWIYSVAVSPDHRRKGVGSQLVAVAERALAARGCVKINLQIMEGNERVTAFYAALGFSVEKRISMGKRINESIPTA
jgi:ribosomal protein S18 acetylase RimI-like enzyme